MFVKFKSFRVSLPSFKMTDVVAGILPKDDVPNKRSLPSRILHRIKSIIQGITVEAALFLALFSEAIRSITQETLIFRRVCKLELKYAEKVCNHLNNETFRDELSKVQQKSMNWMMLNSLLLVLPTIFMSMIIGTWSDKHGRKFPLFFPLIGAALTHILLALCSNFESLPVYTITLALIPSSLFGIFIAILISLSYVSDISSRHQRTSRIAYLEGFSFSGFPIGTLIGGLLFKWFGYIPVFLTGALSNIIAIIYVFIRIKETRGDPSIPWKSRLKDFFNYKIFTASIKTFTRRREGTKRSYIVLLLLALCCFLLYYGCDNSVGFSYSQLVFAWSNFDYSLYQSLTQILGVVANLIMIPILSLFFGVKDVSFGAVGALSAFVNCMVFGYAYSGSIYYVGKFLGMFAFNLPVVIRSFMSKIVHEDELGKVFAFVSMVESLCPILASLLYMYIFKVTSNFFPSMAFFFGAGFMLISFCCFLWIDIQERRHKTSHDLLTESEED